jgi:hypothetical protein
MQGEREKLFEATALLRAAKGRAVEAERRADEAERGLRAIEGSSIWRATEPVRRASERFPTAARLLRRAAKLAFQLFRRFRSWYEHRLHVRSVPPDSSLATKTGTMRRSGRRPLGRDIKLPCTDEPTVFVVGPVNSPPGSATMGRTGPRPRERLRNCP